MKRVLLFISAPSAARQETSGRTVMLAEIFVGSTNFYKNLLPHNSAGVFLFNINGAARKQTRNTVLITTQWAKLRI